ncbi:hypothetical protein [Lewinella sp. IMCC34183]|uniref:hypothetical protein n=1 Tax=Lewinella sp. IMCC34183 TaxID=2248762 RepID=UPI0013009CCE|nr:hypothetical protein [Lewinella sp. IMCC34183]
MRWILLLLLAWPGSRLPAQVVDFFLDPVGKPYYLLADDRFVTANRLGDTDYSWYDSSLGSPDYIDVTNPFQILVYYREYGTVVVLDRTLSELDRIDLFANELLQQPGAIARSYDDGMWVFDSWNYRLVRLDAEGRINQQTNNLRLELGLASAPDAIFVDRNAVMLYFAGEGRLAVFTNYGQFRHWVAVPPTARLSWNAPRLLGIGPDRETWLWSPELRQVAPVGPLPETLSAAQRILAGPKGFLSVGPTARELRATAFEEKN